MNVLAFILIGLGVVFFLIYIAIVIFSVVKLQQIRFRLRLIAVICLSNAFLFGAIGWWLFSIRDLQALPLLIITAIVFGVIGGAGFLSTKPISNKN